MRQEEDQSVDETGAISVTDLVERLDEIIERIARDKTRVMIEQDGQAVAALISAKDMERFVQFEEERAARFAVIDRMREAFSDIPTEQIEADIAAVIAEVRAEDEASRRLDEQVIVERRRA